MSSRKRTRTGKLAVAPGTVKKRSIACLPRVSDVQESSESYKIGKGNRRCRSGPVHYVRGVQVKREPTAAGRESVQVRPAELTLEHLMSGPRRVRRNIGSAVKTKVENRPGRDDEESERIIAHQWVGMGAIQYRTLWLLEAEDWEEYELSKKKSKPVYKWRHGSMVLKAHQRYYFGRLLKDHEHNLKIQKTSCCSGCLARNCRRCGAKECKGWKGQSTPETRCRHRYCLSKVTVGKNGKLSWDESGGASEVIDLAEESDGPALEHVEADANDDVAVEEGAFEEELALDEVGVQRGHLGWDEQDAGTEADPEAGEESPMDSGADEGPVVAGEWDGATVGKGPHGEIGLAGPAVYAEDDGDESSDDGEAELEEEDMPCERCEEDVTPWRETQGQEEVCVGLCDTFYTYSDGGACEDRLPYRLIDMEMECPWTGDGKQKCSWRGRNTAAAHYRHLRWHFDEEKSQRFVRDGFTCYRREVWKGRSETRCPKLGCLWIGSAVCALWRHLKERHREEDLAEFEAAYPSVAGSGVWSGIAYHLWSRRDGGLRAAGRATVWTDGAMWYDTGRGMVAVIEGATEQWLEEHHGAVGRQEPRSYSRVTRAAW